VAVKFFAAGAVYDFDWQHFITTLVAALVLLNIAVHVADTVTFYLMPHGVSEVLLNKRAEQVSKLQSFANLALKAAVNVSAFKALDKKEKCATRRPPHPSRSRARPARPIVRAPSRAPARAADADARCAPAWGRGYIEASDLVSVFGHIDSVSKDQALNMAHTVLRHSDSGGDSHLTFTEFMSCLEGGTLNFDRFVDLVHTTAKLDKLNAEERVKAAQAYDAVEAGIDLDDELARETTRKEGGGAAGFTSLFNPLTLLQKAPQRLSCYSCKKTFGVPDGASVIGCPHCRTPNSVPKQNNTAGGVFGALFQPQVNLHGHRVSQPQAAAPREGSRRSTASTATRSSAPPRGPHRSSARTAPLR
jgi:hypothetical protein